MIAISGLVCVVMRDALEIPITPNSTSMPGVVRVNFSKWTQNWQVPVFFSTFSRNGDTEGSLKDVCENLKKILQKLLMKA